METDQDLMNVFGMTKDKNNIHIWATSIDLMSFSLDYEEMKMWLIVSLEMW